MVDLTVRSNLNPIGKLVNWLSNKYVRTIHTSSQTRRDRGAVRRGANRGIPRAALQHRALADHSGDSSLPIGRRLARDGRMQMGIDSLLGERPEDRKQPDQRQGRDDR